jgi:hypothetical protein
MALLGSGCARCGRPYAAQGIRVLAQREEIAFVQLVCFACQIQTLALVTGVPAAARDTDGADDEALDGEAQEDLLMPGGAEDEEDERGREGGGDGTGERPRWAAPRISEADVLEMRAFLDDYEGDLRGLLEGGSDPAEGEAGPGGE